MAPKLDPEAGCIIPEKGQWPVDPQEDQPLQEDRLWIDGCFDFFHHGHTGVMLQSRRLGNELIVGLHSDEDIAANKGPTVMNLDERIAAVEACRFSTKCIPHAPYVTSIPWISHYGCKYVTHGDDITSDASGEDCYRYVKKAGRMKIVPRTPGISTTDLVGRMLLCTRTHFIKNLSDALDGKEGRGSEEERLLRGREMRKRIEEYSAAENGRDRWVDIHQFRPKHRPKERRRSSMRRSGEDTTQKDTHDPGKGGFLPLVSGHPPRPGQRVVYVDGGFDLFSSGHIAFLQQVNDLENKRGEENDWFSDSAKAHRISETGSDYGPAYIIAGIHDDEVINYHKGINYPIMNIFERGLCVVQCRYIHAVIFSAPYTPTHTYLSTLPNLPATTNSPDIIYHGPTNNMVSPNDPYADAKSLGLYQQTEQHRFQDVNSESIVKRILDKRVEYEERQKKKGDKGVSEQGLKKREELEVEQRREMEKRLKEVERQFGA